MFASAWFVGANDGVGGQSARAEGHAGLWARLIPHYRATALYTDAARHQVGVRADAGGVPPAGVRADGRGDQGAERSAGDDDGGGGAAALQAWRRGEVQPLLYVTNVGTRRL